MTKKIFGFLLLAAGFFLGGCTQQLEIVEQPAMKERIAYFSISDAESLLVASEDDGYSTSSVKRAGGSRRKKLYKKTSRGKTEKVTYTDNYGNDVPDDDFTVQTIEKINPVYIKIKYLDQDDNVFYYIVNTQTGETSMSGDDIDESAEICYLRNGQKYYYQSKDERVVQLDLNTSLTGRIKKTIMRAIDGLSYSNACVDDNENIIADSRFIKRVSGGFENIEFNLINTDIYVNQETGEFNYYNEGVISSVYLNDNNEVCTAAISSATPNVDLQYIYEVRKQSPILENNGNFFYMYEKRNYQGTLLEIYLIKYDNNLGIQINKYDKAAKITASNDSIYVMTDNNNVEKVDPETFAGSSFFITTEYDMTDIGINADSELFFYGFRYEDSSYVEVIVNDNGVENVVSSNIIAEDVSYLTRII
jgi:hypothetical protein